MERKDINLAYNTATELERLKLEQARMLLRLQEIPTEIEKREAALRSLGL